MRKTLLSLFILIVAIALNAQTKFGIKGGVSSSSIKVVNGENYLDMDRLTGLSGGLMIDTKIMQRASLHCDLLYQTRGADYTEYGSLVKYRIQYLQLPVLFSYHVQKLRLNAGPYLGYALNGKITSTAMGVSGYSYDVNAFKNDYGLSLKRFDAGYVIGVGVAATEHIVVNVTLENSFLNMDPNNDFFISHYKAYNRSLALSVGYYL